MPSAPCILLVAAALVTCLVSSFAPALAMASPMPQPIPVPSKGTSYHHAVSDASAMRTKARKSTRVKHIAAHNVSAAPPVNRRMSTALLTTVPVKASHKDRRTASPDYYDQMNGYYNSANTHSQNLKSLAAQSSSVQDNDSDFDQQAATQLTAFHTQMLGFEGIFRQFGADAGLKNYNRADDIETLLKNVVNLHKNTLSYVTTITYNLPIVGKTLGPIVYEIKCLLDLVLDGVENTTDAILNALRPILEPLIGKYFTTACNNGIGLPTCIL